MSLMGHQCGGFVLVAAAFLGSAVTTEAQQPGKSGTVKKAPRVKKPPLPNRDTFIMMARTVMIAVHHANLTGNYSVLRELGSPDFQKRYSTADLSNRFSGFRKVRINLGPVALFVPRLTQPPKYVKPGIIVLSGFFPTKPTQIKFELYFQIVGGAWRLYEMAISLV